MNIQLNSLHPSVKTLATRLIDHRHQGKGQLQTESLGDIEKRFLRSKGISFSFNHENKNWEIQLNN